MFEVKITLKGKDIRTLIVSASTMSEAEELVRTDGYRQGLFDPFAGEIIALVEPIKSNLYPVVRAWKASQGGRK